MSYTKEDIAQQEGIMLGVVLVLLVVCGVWFCLTPNILILLIFGGIVVVSIIAMGNFGEWNDFIDTYSE